jgi:hypothetical protein
MYNVEERIIESIDLQKGLLGLNPGSLVLQKIGSKWKPAIIIGSKKQGDDIQLWTAEEEIDKEIKYVCWGLVRKPEIKIVKNSMVTGLTLKNLISSLREFSQEANKLGIKKILAKASDICEPIGI